MLETYQYRQLNDEAKAYLRTVRETSGRGSPGVYFSKNNSWPMVAFLVGATVLFITFMLAYTSPKEPLPTAFLLTAGFMFGGWLMTYAIRRWRASPDNYGLFYYFDPEYVYVAEGETIRFAHIGSGVKADAFGQNQVRFAGEDFRFAVTLPNSAAVQLVADYYQALTWVHGRKEGKWADLPPAETGGVAKYLAEFDDEPGDIQETGLTIGELPNEVRPVRRPASGVGGILLLMLIGAGSLAGFYFLNEMMLPLRDDQAFNEAVEANTATKYRDYLRYEKHVRHRPEAEEKLAALYEVPIAAVKTRATNEDLKQGMVQLLDSLRKPTSPNVSIRVRMKTPGAAGSDSSGQDMADLRTRFADGIATELAGPNKDLISFANAPDDKKAHITIIYTQVNDDIHYEVEIRLTPTDVQPIASNTGDENMGAARLMPFGLGAGAGVDPVGELVYSRVMMKLVGMVPPAPGWLVFEE